MSEVTTHASQDLFQWVCRRYFITGRRISVRKQNDKPKSVILELNCGTSSLTNKGLKRFAFFVSMWVNEMINQESITVLP